MIDIDKLEALAKDAAETGLAGHRIKFFLTVDPESVLTLIAEVRALREFHGFFRDRCEGLFAQFGMGAVDAYNDAARGAK